MIVEVVAGDVGEAAGGKAKSVEPELIETMRRCFDRQMGDALAGQRVDRAMQIDRIGRRQRTVNFAARRDDADGADAGGAMTERAPDLPSESGDGGFAASAGDRDDGLRLARIKFCRDER